MNDKNKSRRKFLTNATAVSLITLARPLNTMASTAKGYDITNDYNFDLEFNRIGVNSKKWDSAISVYGEDKIKIPMTIADMDFKQAPEVMQALKNRIKYEGFGYENPSTEYYNSIINWQKKRHSLHLEKEWIKNSSGITAAIGPALRAFNPVGGKVLIMTPTYNGFMQEIEKVGMTISMSPMKRNSQGQWEMDLEDLEERIDSNTKCLILCNPNNPTGNCWTRSELQKLGDVCIRNGITVLSDEIWADVIRDGKNYTPYASIGEKYAQSSLTFTSAAKVFNQPMLKTAYFYSKNIDLIKAVMLKGGHHDEVNTFGLVATEAAYNKSESWMLQMNKYIDENFKYLDNVINYKGELPGVKLNNPDCTYIAWLDCKDLMDRLLQGKYFSSRVVYEEPERFMSEWLVEKAGILLNPGTTYGIGGEGHLRMNIAVPKKHLIVALNNISQAIKMI